MTEHNAAEEMTTQVDSSVLDQGAEPVKATPTNSPIPHGSMAQTQISSTDGSDSPATLSTFHLPNISMYPDDVWDFASDLVERSTMASLENAGRLNWWTRVGASCQRLLPLVTRGDGNCLLHAASMSIWGIQDRDLTLRKSLHAQMDHGLNREALRRRWRWQQAQQNRELGLWLTEEEWQKEWNELLKLASSEPKTQYNSDYGSMQTDRVKSPEMPIYESLEEFHVFVLAHVMRRPIIVVADTMLKDSEGEAFAPISFGGIYLPLEVPAIECQSIPLVLAYDNGHFSALAFIEQKDSFQIPAVIPLTDSEYSLLPVHFAVDPGEEWEWDKNKEHLTPERVNLSLEAKLQLLHSYLNIIWFPLSHHWQQLSMATTEPASPTGDKDHTLVYSRLDAEPVCSTCSGHLEVCEADGGAEANDRKAKVGCRFSGTGPHCKKGKPIPQNLVTDKVGGFRSLRSKTLNMGELMVMKTVGGSRDKSEENHEKEKCSLKGDKGDGEPEISGQLSSPSCSEQHNTGIYPSKDGNVVKLSLDLLQAAMQGDRSCIFAALLSPYSYQPYKEVMIQQYMAAAKESLEVEQEPWQNMQQKEVLVSSSEVQEKETSELDFAYMLKDGSTSCSSFDPHVSNGIYPSTHPSIFPFSQLSLAPFIQSSLAVTRKLAGSFSSFCFSIPFSDAFSQHLPPTQDLPQIQHCIADSSSYLSEPIQEAASPSNSCRDTSWDSQNSPPPVSHSSLDSRPGIVDSEPRKCRVTSCNFYGCPETENYCSCCYREELRRRKMKPDLHSS